MAQFCPAVRSAPGSFVNLGIGQPTLVSNYLVPKQNITLHTENGMLGMGPVAVGEEIDCDLINAGKIPVTELAGTSYFHHRGFGDRGEGGLHDDVPVHPERAIEARPECTYPLTGVGCVRRVYTDKAMFLTGPDGVRVRETFGTTLA